jgi:predicted DNA-binding ribbon-helix-helix protein
MSQNWFVGLCAATTLLLAGASVDELQSADPRDADVLAAVVKSDLWFRPSERAAQVLGLNQTLPICPESGAGRPCVPARDVDRLTQDAPRARGSLGNLSSAIRVELVESFKTRNNQRRETPRVPGVILAPPGQVLERTEATAKHYTVFSLPGYAQDDHAIVVVQHLDASGGSDNQELLYLLTRGSREWRVIGRFVLWIA